MKVVIDIPEHIYDHAVWCSEDSDDEWFVMRAIAKCTILPEGHGRLIDAEKLKKDYPHDTDWDYPVNTNRYVVESIDNAPTIIEAYKDGE